MEAVKCEMMAVLSSIKQMATTPFRVTSSTAVASPSTTAVIAPPNIQQCMQLIFELIDHLTSWIHEEASSDPSHHHPSASADSAPTNAATRADSPHLIVQPVATGGGGPICRTVIERKRFLDSIDKSTLANAAHACNAHTRAYKYYESYLHEERQKVRKAHAAAIPEKIKATASSRDARLIRLGQLDVGMADGMTADDLHLLQRLYASMDEPDGMSGIAALRPSSSSLAERIRDLLSVGQWSDALTCYDHALQSDQSNLDLHCGFLDCLLHLGRLSELMTYVQGLMTQERWQGWSSTISAFGVQAAWRMRDWDRLRVFTQSIQPRQRAFQVHLADILAALHVGDEGKYHQSMQAGRMVVMESLTTASMESYQRAYPYCLQLQMLQEVDHMRRLMGFVPSSSSTSSSSAPSVLAALHQHWTLRLNRTKPSFKLREPLLALRRVLYDEYRDDADAGSTWLEVAHQARKAGQFETATGALLHADLKVLDPLRLAVERSKLMRAKGHPDAALQFLERHLLVSSPRSPIQSTAFLLVGKWHQQLVSADFSAVYAKLQLAGTDTEKGFFRLGEFHDRYMEKKRKQKVSGIKEALITGVDSKGREDLMNQLRRARMRPFAFMKKCLECYGEALKRGHKFTTHTMPRLLTIYLEHAEVTAEEDKEGFRKDSARDGHSNSAHKEQSRRSTRATHSSSSSSSSTSDKSHERSEALNAQLHGQMMDFIPAIAPYKWSPHADAQPPPPIPPLCTEG